jgi:hypothetical protein
MIKVERPNRVDSPTGPANIVEPDSVVMEPETVRVDYPDGSHLHAGWQYSGPADCGHEQYIVKLPASARLVNGMVVRTSRDVLVSVAVRDVPVQMRTLGGGFDAL